jgi:iron complex transport system ATP-binding protein
MSIIVEHLSHSYSRVQSLLDVSCTANSGSITALIGPNAAGKSTLLRCIIGALRPDAGQVCVDGLIVSRSSPSLLARRIAYVPQTSVVSAAFTVRQVVQLGRYVLPVAPYRVQSAIDDLELGEIAQRPYPQLSVGQQQRVTLARALAQLEPEGHLVLDEPFSAMDLRHVKVAVALIKQVAAAGAAVIIAMHDLALASQLADDIWMLDGGRLAAHGSTGEVLLPGPLRRVFGVEFEWVSSSAGRFLLPVHSVPPNSA